MSEALYYIENNFDYSWFFVSLVTDVNTQAMARKNTFGFAGYPSAFWDAGDEVLVGGYGTGYISTKYTPLMTSSLQREVPSIDLSVDLTWNGDGTMEIDYEVVCNEIVNAEPEVPAAPAGATAGAAGIEYSYSASTTDYEGDSLYFQFDWGDGETTELFGPYGDNDICTASHVWSLSGDYDVTVRAKDVYIDNYSDWSAPTSIVMYDYLSGDANADLACNIIDIVYLIDFLYNSGPQPTPYYAADVDVSLIVNIIDISYIINFLYQGGPAPQYP